MIIHAVAYTCLGLYWVIMPSFRKRIHQTNVTLPVTVPVKNPARLHPTADTWVAKNDEGELVAIKVTDMTDGHLRRWIRYFREKVRKENPTQPIPNSQIDVWLKANMVTAPAIYAEAQKRGIDIADLATAVAIDSVPKTEPRAGPAPMTKEQRAARLITLEDD